MTNPRGGDVSADTAVSSGEPSAAVGTPGPGGASCQSAAAGPVVPQRSGSIEGARAVLEQLAGLDLEEIGGDRNALMGALFNLRKAARGELAHPAPVPDDTRRRRLIEDIYEQPFPSAARRDAFLAAQLRRHRAERLSELDAAVLEDVLQVTARTAQQQDWPLGRRRGGW